MNRVTLLIAALAVLISVPAFADSIFYVDLTNSNSAALPDGPVYGTVTITFSGSSAFISADVTDPDLAGSGFQTFGLNPINFASITGLPANWSAGSGGNEDGFGNFSVNVSTAGAGNRKDPLQFTVNFNNAFDSGSTFGDFFGTTSGAEGTGTYFAGHIAGFSLDGSDVTSAYFGGGLRQPPDEFVPEPGSLLLLGSGLIGLALCCRKFKNR